MCKFSQFRTDKLLKEIFICVDHDDNVSKTRNLACSIPQIDARETKQVGVGPTKPAIYKWIFIFTLPYFASVFNYIKVEFDYFKFYDCPCAIGGRS